jgi:hypothetical protein
VAIMERFKDTAAFGRQASLGFGESIVGATEGIKNQNEILLDNAGMSTNATHLIQQQGGALTDFANISTDATTRTRFFNGMMNDTSHQLGNAAVLSGNFSGEQAKLGTVIFNTQGRLGDLLKGGIGPLIQGGVTWLQNNQQVAVSLMGAGGAVVAFGGALIGLVSAARFVTLVLGGPVMLILAALSAVVGVVAFGAFNKLQNQMMKTTDTGVDGAGKIGAASQEGMGTASKAARKLAEQLAELADNVVKAARDYQQSLTDIVKSHEDKIADLKKQTADEQASFAKAQADKTDSFKQAQDDMTIQHQESVDQIQRDLDNETLKGRFADQSRIQDLQLRLQKENDSYARSTAEKLAAYQKDTDNAKAADTTKLTDLQSQLAQETGFLQQHSADLRGIRAADALDEIDKLKQSHADQMKSFEDQRRKIIENANSTAGGIAGAFNSVPSQINPNAFSGLGAQLGHDMGRALKDAFLSSWGDMVNSIGSAIGKWVMGNSGLDKLKPGWARGILHDIGVPGFATGGVVPGPVGAPMLVLAHGGEAITPPGGPFAGGKTSPQGYGGGGKTINQTNNYYITSSIDMEAATRSQMLELRLA